MATLAELQADLDALRRIRNAGVSRVRYDDKETTYRTDAEITAAIRDVEAQISDLQGATVRTVRFTTSKGL
ncbi:MAG: hypothetical protein JSS08_07775 [Proteobacteria bacterium]|nr:hypothetical protein [Pseudomonadota bacterium]